MWLVITGLVITDVMRQYCRPIRPASLAAARSVTSAGEQAAPCPADRRAATTSNRAIFRMSEHRADLIRQALVAALAPERLEIVDESHLHAGHAGAREGKGHFRIHVVAECFRGLAPIKRHRKIYAALGALMETDIHALGIDARTPDE